MENMKKVMVQFDFPGMTAKQYDQVWQDLRVAGHENPQGLEFYVSTSGAINSPFHFKTDTPRVDSYFTYRSATRFVLLRLDFIRQ